MQEFIYSYTKVIDAGFNAERADAWIVPEVEIAYAVKAYNLAGEPCSTRSMTPGSPPERST